MKLDASKKTGGILQSVPLPVQHRHPQYTSQSIVPMLKRFSQLLAAISVGHPYMCCSYS